MGRSEEIAEIERTPCPHAKSSSYSMCFRHGDLKTNATAGWAQKAWGRRKPAPGLSVHETL